jgi:predicted dinucleotide-binding enzyme
MTLGIIGAGNIGATAAKLFVDAGHEIAISNSRGPGSLREIVAGLGDRATAVSVDEAVHFGDIVFISVPFGKYSAIPAGGFSGKIVIDSNNYYPDRDGHFPGLDSGQTTSSELLQEHLPGARIVKAFNTIWSEHLKSQGNPELPLDQRRVIFIASDDSEAKEAVAKLIEQLGFAAVDTGFLHDGGSKQQPGTPVYNKFLTVSEAAALLSDDE